MGCTVVATIVVITHHYDAPMYTSRTEDGLASPYMLGPIIVELASRGHRVTIVKGVPRQAVAADLAVLHVDLTVVSTEYLEFAASFPFCLNGRVATIAKRAVADGLLRQDTDWTGAVIVKTDLNYRGLPELRANRLAEVAHLPPPFPLAAGLSDYLTFASAAEVPGPYWLHHGLVVQKFLPERLADGFGIRFWTFLGDVERCDICVASTPLVKAATTLRLEPSPVPERLRALRERLGRLLLSALLERNVECLHLRSAAAAVYDTAGYDADLGHAGHVSDAIHLLGEVGATAVVAGSTEGVAYAEAVAEGLGLPTNRLDRFAARAQARISLTAVQAGTTPQFIINSVSRAGDHAITDIWRRAADGPRAPLDPDDRAAGRLICAAREALDRLGVVNGAAHTRFGGVMARPLLLGSVGVLDAEAGRGAGPASQAGVYAHVLAGTDAESLGLRRAYGATRG
jgi:hypothetical protein